MTTLTMKADGLRIAQAVGALTEADVNKVYSGTPSASDNHCRCGCRGIYRYNPARFAVGSDVRGASWPLEAEDLNASTVRKILKAVKAEALAGNASMTVTLNDEDRGWVDVQLASGRCYTIYVAEGGLR